MGLGPGGIKATDELLARYPGLSQGVLFEHAIVDLKSLHDATSDGGKKIVIVDKDKPLEPGDHEFTTLFSRYKDLYPSPKEEKK